MNITQLASDIAHRVPDLNREVVTNREAVIAGMIRNAGGTNDPIWVIKKIESWGGGHGEGPTTCYGAVIGYFTTSRDADAECSRLNGKWGKNHEVVMLCCRG